MECSNLVEDVFLDRGTLLGIVGGSIVFICILSFIIYNNSDFDSLLIKQVDKGVSAEELIPQIDNETEKLKLKAKKRLESYVFDKKYWGNGELASPDDYQRFTQSYENDMKMITEYENARKKFVKREITKEQFSEKIETPKEYFIIYY